MDAYHYREEIIEFFKGKDYYDNYSKGHIWICRHEGFDTLTVEPLVGGQYEIAVRIPQQTPDGIMWVGYWCNPNGYFHGVNTGGH